MNAFITLLIKYKSIVLYGIFGVLTTVVNVVVYGLMAHICRLATVPSSVIAWIFAVAFAYITNRKWVFGSDNHTSSAVAGEVFRFFLCRLATGIIDWVFMYITVDLLILDDILMKIIANIIVIILNYAASKVLVFTKRSAEK